MPSNWNTSAKWYQERVGLYGHYYHQHTIFPKLKPLINQLKPSSVLDLGCGQGVLARQLNQEIEYLGLDSSAQLIQTAKKMNSHSKHQYSVADISGDLSFIKDKFDLAFFILSLQNCIEPRLAIQNAAKLLKPSGRLVIVLNHPCFRIPRQSGWNIDPHTKIQFRYQNLYRQFLKIPIRIEPSLKEQSPIAWSFHFSLGDLFSWFNEFQLKTVNLEEWYSDKQSVGKNRQPENQARQEFPLFLTLTLTL